MNDNSNDLKNSVKEHSKNLEKLGKDLSENKFNYKVLNETKTEYWENRIHDFKRYQQKGIEYYTQVHALMNLIDKEKAVIFLLSLSKLRQLGTELLELFEEIKQNPTIMSSKDKQQSKWSKEIKDQLIDYSNQALQQETDMNTDFRQFYDNYLKNFAD